MADTSHDSPNWGLVGVGADGAEMASRVVTGATRAAFDDRIALLGTNVADLREYAERIGAIETGDSGSAVADTDRVVTFGPHLGPQFDLTGIVAAERRFRADTERIVQPLRRVLDGADAIVYFADGRANWAVPTLVDRIGAAANGQPSDGQDGTRLPRQFIITTLPSDGDAIQSRFDACYTLFGLLGPDDRQSARTTFLASKPTLQEQYPSDPMDTPPRAGSNGLPHGPIVGAVELFVAASRRFDATSSTHGTFGLARDYPIGLEPSVAIESAAESTFAPLDLSTVDSVSLVVSAPEKRIQSDAITAAGVADAFDSWAAERGISERTRESRLVSRSGGGHTFDVLLVPRGFDLGPVFDPLQDAYEQSKAMLERSGASRDLARAERLERRVRNLDNDD